MYTFKTIRTPVGVRAMLYERLTEEGEHGLLSTRELGLTYAVGTASASQHGLIIGSALIDQTVLPPDVWQPRIADPLPTVGGLITAAQETWTELAAGSVLVDVRTLLKSAPPEGEEPEAVVLSSGTISQTKRLVAAADELLGIVEIETFVREEFGVPSYPPDNLA